MRDPDRPTLGFRVAEVAAALGLELMPWQQHVADVALEYDPVTGRLAHREVNVSVPRQSGKTTLALAAMVHRCTRFGPGQSVAYLAQSRKAAVAKWRDQHVPLLERSPFADLFTVRRSNGAEAVLWANGSIYGLDAPTETSGHGLTLDLALVDEAWAFEDDRQEQALAPAMLTRPSAQLWVMSTAGNTRSRWWWSKVQAGRAAEPGGSTAYFEWSAPDDADPADPAVWAAAIPSLGHTVDEAAVADELDRANRGGSVDLFRRAYLNQWVDPPTVRDQQAVLPVEWWDRCHDPASATAGDVVFAVDMTPDRSTVAIVVAGVSSSGGVHVEVVEHRSDTGAEWLLARLTDLAKRHRCRAVAAHLGGPMGSLESALRTVFGDRLRPVSDRELLAASGGMFDAIRDATVRHVGEPSIRAALEGAAKSYSGDMWRWSRRGSHVDISPLVAATLAHYVASQPAPPTPAPATVMWI